MTSWCKALYKVAALGLMFGVSGAAAAFGNVAFEFGTTAGSTDVDRFGVVAKKDWNARWLESGEWFLSGYWEVAISYWDGDKGRYGNDTLFDFSGTPVLRYQRSPGTSIAPFVELGVGIHVHTDDTIGNKDFDIPFSFGNHIGAGFRFGAHGRYEVLYRFQHLSNASIGDKNPGINFHVIQLGYRF